MRFSQSQPAALLTVADAMAHLRIDDQSQADYVATLIVAAVGHAEQQMETSLLSRTITATFYNGDVYDLPRGPVQSITSVALDGIAIDSSRYQLQGKGSGDYMLLDSARQHQYDARKGVVVVYVAGYGDNPGDVPADILQAIRCHIGLMYENREVAADRTITPVPFLDGFYKTPHARELGIG